MEIRYPDRVPGLHFTITRKTWAGSGIMKYIFRGNTVFEYDPKTKTMRAGEECCDGFETNVFNFCKFISEDYELLSVFFKQAYFHATDQPAYLKDMVVD